MNEPELIHRFVPGMGEEPRTLLLLHGTGGDETDLLPLGQTLLPGSALLSPRGRVTENGMPRFFRRLAPGVFDHADLVARTHELADFVASSAARYGLDAARIVAVGYSNGANVAASLLLMRPETLSAAILLRPMVPLVPEALPDLRGRPVLIAAARQDSIASPAETERLAALLGRAGAEVEVQWQPGGHGLTSADILVARKWLERKT